MPTVKMSFGWSVGNIFTAIEFIYEVSEALKSSAGSPESRIRANEFLGTFNHTINVGSADLWTKFASVSRQ